MDLRITPQTLVNDALVGMEAQTTRLGQLQEQSSSGKRIQVPSDDPVDWAAVQAGTAQDTRIDTYLANISSAQASLNQSVTNLNQAANIFVQARQIAEEGSQSTNTPQALSSLADQVDQLLNQLLSNANTQQNGIYQYSGTAVHTQPFAVTASDSQGRPETIVYQGSKENSQILVGPGQSIDLNYSGQQIFQQQQRGPTQYSGPTGAAAGTGTDSATGQGTLLVQHTSTTYAAGSGVQAGASSASGDTIIGPAGAHQLTLTDTSGTGSGGTASLDGGPPVNFSSSDTDLKVTGPNGQVVFINTTAITPGFNGTVNITANGSLSVDGGASSVPINFSGNQIVTNSKTGAVTNVNSTNIRQAGTDTLDYQGTYDAFQVLMALRDDLRNVGGLNETQQLQSISGRLGEIDRVQNNILEAVGQQSASLKNLDDLQSSAQQTQLGVRQFTGNLENADLTQVVVQLQAQQNMMQLTLAFTARMFDQSLLNFLH